MNDDAALLHRYAADGSNPAFTELVRRHLDLVYRAALRRTGGDTHRAEDVAQQVFTALARDARKLSRHTVLVAWLHTATRNAALNLMISEQRRQARELAAHALAPAAADAPLDWDQLRPVLDAAIDELPEADRTAVILRYLEQRPFAEVGAALRLSTDAARLRTTRALDQLREVLARRGLTSTAAAVGALVSSQPLVSAPPDLAAVLAARALGSLGGATSGAAASFLNMKFLTAASLTAIAAFGAGVYFGLGRATDLPPPPAIDHSRTAALVGTLRDENLALRTQVEQLTARLAALAQAPKPPPPTAPGKSRGELQLIIINNLRQLAAARDQFILEEGRPPYSTAEIVGYTRYVKRFLPIDGEDYRSISLDPTQPMTVTTASGLTVTYDSTGRGPSTKPELTPEVMHAKVLQYKIDQADAKVSTLEKKIVPVARQAEAAYRAVHKRYPANPEELLPYFATPQAGADWVEFIEANKAAVAARTAK
jgi:RNA polymerase sigma factor (sigma-70 family)